jgi:predicted PurR-regulated permease PerM
MLTLGEESVVPLLTGPWREAVVLLTLSAAIVGCIMLWKYVGKDLSSKIVTIIEGVRDSINGLNETSNNLKDTQAHLERFKASLEKDQALTTKQAEYLASTASSLATISQALASHKG